MGLPFVSLEGEKHWHPTLGPLDDVLPDWNRITAPFRQPPGRSNPDGQPRLLLDCDFDAARVVPSVGPYFHGAADQYDDGAQRQDGAEAYRDLWHHINLSVPVPFGRWMTVETYVREVGVSTGRFYAAVTPEGGVRTVLFDVRGTNHHPDNPATTGVKQFSPLKLYTSAEVVDFLHARGRALEVDWDDLKIWQGRTPEDG